MALMRYSEADAARVRKRAAEVNRSRERSANGFYKRPVEFIDSSPKRCTCDRDVDNGEGYGLKCGRPLNVLRSLHN